jgi:hemolysin III
MTFMPDKVATDVAAHLRPGKSGAFVRPLAGRQPRPPRGTYRVGVASSHRSYSAGEEIAHVATHGAGAILSGAALAILVVLAAQLGDAWHVVSTAIYGTTLVLLYTASTVYHGVRSPRAKHVARIIDHAAIYLLIAGTYTPFTLVTLRGHSGWLLFGTVWGLAVLGVIFEASWVGRPKWLSAAVYLAMGWMVVVATSSLLAALAAPGLWLLLAGGLAYTFGTVFYAMPRVRYMHAVWHVFVLGGSVCHFLSVALYVIPDGALVALR